jgi:hypothetical protein
MLYFANEKITKYQNLTFIFFCQKDNLLMFPSFSDVSLDPEELHASK